MYSACLKIWTCIAHLAIYFEAWFYKLIFLKSARPSPETAGLVLKPLIAPSALGHGLSETNFSTLLVHKFKKLA